MKKIFLILSLLLPVASWATPAQVLIIRHAEKPKSGKDLSPQGQERAQALVGFFQNNPPVAIYAMSDEGNRTRRPIETVTPLAQALGLSINKIVEDQSDSMVSEVLSNPAYDGKMVLVCWVHDDIPNIAQQFGATQAPGEWDDKSTFDRVWEIDYKDGQVSGFSDLPQHLLPGDSTN